MFPRAAGTAVLLLAVCAAGGRAQETRPGRADLRYVMPMPSKVTYAGADTLDMVVAGTPMGDMNLTGHLSSTIELSFTPAADSLRARVEVKEFGGTMQTPMGAMPLSGPLPAPAEFSVGVKGVDAAASLGISSNAAPQEVLSQGRNASVPWLRLPGRELAIGETWVDTMNVSQTVEGLNVEVQVIVHGTYASDTVAGGRTLNLLTFRNTVTMKSGGSYQGMPVEQTMTMTSDERVLWDSARHTVTARTAEGQMKMDTSLPGTGTMQMTGKTRSHHRIVE